MGGTSTAGERLTYPSDGRISIRSTPNPNEENQRGKQERASMKLNAAVFVSQYPCSTSLRVEEVGGLTMRRKG